MAFTHEGNKAGIICHSDRGVQYASKLYRDLLNGKNAIPSMKLKSEKELRSDLFKYIEI
jgi:transposase InsO family protein